VVSVDSTIVRAHYHAAGVPVQAPIDVAAERLLVAFCQLTTAGVGAAGGLSGGAIELHESAVR
jgi:hypothetical protein